MYEYDPKLQREYAAKQLGIKKPAGNGASDDKVFEEVGKGLGKAIKPEIDTLDNQSTQPPEPENKLQKLGSDLAGDLKSAVYGMAAGSSELLRGAMPPSIIPSKAYKDVENYLTENAQEARRRQADVDRDYAAKFVNEMNAAEEPSGFTSAKGATVWQPKYTLPEYKTPSLAHQAVRGVASTADPKYLFATGTGGAAPVIFGGVEALSSRGRGETPAEQAKAFTTGMGAALIPAAGIKAVESLPKIKQPLMEAQALELARQRQVLGSEPIGAKALQQEPSYLEAIKYLGEKGVEKAGNVLNKLKDKLPEEVLQGEVVMPKPYTQNIQKTLEAPPKKSVGAAGQDLTTSAIPLTELPKEPITVKTEAGVKTTITPKQGEEFTVTPYKTSEGKVKFELHDGDSYTVAKNTATELVNKFGLVERDFSIPKELEVVKKGTGKLKSSSIEEMQRQSSELMRQAQREQARGNNVGANELFNQQAELERQIEDLALGQDVYDTGVETKYAKYQLAEGQGAKNYREVLLKAPHGKDSWEEFKSSAMGDVFKSTHWDEPNVIAHTRLAEHTADGKQTTLLEEIQSDWAREGRDKGFRPTSEKSVEELNKRRLEIEAKGKTATPEEKQEWAEAMSIIERKGVPHHPALKDWQTHTLKHAIKEAVDAGSDTLSWVTGQQTADRYNLSKQVKDIEWNGYDKNNKLVSITPTKGNQIEFLVNGDGMTSGVGGGSADGFAGKPLSEVIGKEVAKKIISEKYGSLSGNGLNIGGEWASNLYDRQIPNLLKDLTKGYGTQFKDITLENGETVHSMTLTPRLKAAFQKDQGTVGAMSKAGKTDSDVLGEVNNIFAEPEEVKQPLGRKLLELSDKAKQHIYREYQPLNRLEADIYKTYGVDRPKMPLANKFELVKGAGGKADADRIEFGERVIKPIERLYESDVDAYFFLKRTIDRLTKDADKRKVGTFTIEKAQNGLAQLRAKLGEEDFAKLEKSAVEYQKLMDDSLKLQVKTGGMSIDEYNNIKALNDFYAPFQVIQDVNEKEYTGAGKSVSGAKKLTKSIKGISSDDFRLKNIMTSSLEQITMGRILSEKRLAMQELDKLADIDINKTFIRREIAEPTGKIEALNNRLVKLAELQEKQRQLQIQRDSLDVYRRSLYGKQVARRQAARTAAQQIDLDKGKSTVESRISLSPLFRAGRMQTPEMKRVWKQQIAEINKSIQQEQRVPEASIPFLQGLRSEMEAYIESTPDIKKAIRRLGGISPLKEAQSWGLTGEIKSLKESDLSLFNNKGLSLDRMAGAISDEFPHVYPERLTPDALIQEISKANVEGPPKYTAKDIKLLDRVLEDKIRANDISTINQLLEQINSEITAMGEEPIKPAVDKLQEGLKFAKGQYSMPVVNKGLFRKLTLLENKLADYRETSLAEQAAMLDEVREMVSNKDVTITEARDLLKRVSGQLAAEKVNVAATKAKSAAEKMAIRTNYKLRSKRFKDLEEKIKNTETYLNRVAKGSILIQDKVPLPTGWERVSFLKNGNVVTLQVKQDVAEAVKGLNAQQTGMIRTILQMGAVPLRWGATGVNAGFQFFNMLFRDPARLALISKMGLRSPLDLVRFPIEWIHSLYSAMKLNFGTPNQLAEEFLRNGMGGGTAAEYFDPTAFAKKYGFKKDLTVKDVAKKVVMLPKDVLDFLAKLGNVGEQTTKLLGYKRGKRIFGINQLEGKAAEEATKELAWEVRNMAGSPDFSQGGNTTKQLNSVFMFLNARVRAMQTDFARLGGSHGAGPAGAAWGRLGLLIGLPTTLLMMYNLKDDNKEDYQKRPEWERKNYWLVPRYDENGKPLYFTNEDGDQVREYYRWPKNDILQMVANSIEGGVQFADSKDHEALKSLGVDLLENISPITIQGDDLTERTQSVLASMNPMISVPVSWATNKNLRLHSDTVPMSKQGASPYLQSRQSTPEFYKQIGRAFAKTDKDTGELVGGISPAKLEQAVGNFTGGAFGQFVLPEKVEGRSPLSVLPVAKRVFGGARIEEPEIKSLEKMLTRQADRRVILKDKAIEFIKATKNMPPGEGNRQYAEIEKSDPQLAEKIAEVKFEMDKGFSRDDQLLKQLGIENGARAKWLHDKTKNMTPEDRQSYLEGYWNKGLITDDVVNQLRELKK